MKAESLKLFLCVCFCEFNYKVMEICRKLYLQTFTFVCSLDISFLTFSVLFHFLYLALKKSKTCRNPLSYNRMDEVPQNSHFKVFVEVPWWTEWIYSKVNSRLNFNKNAVRSPPQMQKDGFVWEYLEMKWPSPSDYFLFRTTFVFRLRYQTWFLNEHNHHPVNYSVITHFCWLSRNSVTKNSMHSAASLRDFANANICHSTDAEVTF